MAILALLMRAWYHRQSYRSKTELAHELTYRAISGWGFGRRAVADLDEVLEPSLDDDAAVKESALQADSDPADPDTAAAACYRRVLELDPSHTRAYLALGRTLLAQGERGEALRYLRHGATAAARPEQVAAALAEAERGGSPGRR